MESYISKNEKIDDHGIPYLVYTRHKRKQTTSELSKSDPCSAITSNSLAPKGKVDGHVIMVEHAEEKDEFCSTVQDVADSCRTGATSKLIFGLALGDKYVIIPIFAIAASIFVCFSFAAMYGIVVAALGMLSTMTTRLAFDAYDPINDDAGGIAKIAGMSHRIQERTDALDVVGNKIVAIGKF